MTWPMTWPICCMESAPVAPIDLVDQGVDLGVGELRGRVGRDHRSLGVFLVREFVPPGTAEGFSGFVPLLDLLGRDVSDLVVGQLVTEFVLLVTHGGREHAQRAEAGLVPAPQRSGHLLVDLGLQGSLAHYTALP